MSCTNFYCILMYYKTDKHLWSITENKEKHQVGQGAGSVRCSVNGDKDVWNCRCLVIG